MGYQKHRDVIAAVDSGNVICDGYNAVKYEELPLLLEKLDTFFEEHKTGETGCLGVFIQNSALLAVVIIYLLAEKKNFFLYSGNRVSPGDVPFFCDKILTGIANSTTGPDPSSALTITLNPGFVNKTHFLQSRSGLVFFSSSGTSGPAKYICFSAGNLVRNATNCIKRFAMHPGTRTLVTVPASHMYGMGVGLLPSLITGASVCLIEKNNVVKFFTHVAAFNPHITLITPALARMVLALNKAVTGRRTYITAGEKIDISTHRDFESRYGLLVNLYGCTELGAIATSSMSDADAEARLMGVLEPLEGVHVKAGNGPYAELLVRHNAGFEGYLDNDGVLHAPALVDGIYFRTRDAGTAAGNGSFIVSGRMDNCINRSGFLISLDEVESKLRNLFPEFRQVVVFESGNTNGINKKLVAVCETEAESGKDDQPARIKCKSNMGRYAVPDEFVFVQNLPLLNNGKADRQLIKQQYGK